MFLVAWIVAPIVLGILLAIEMSKSSKLIKKTRWLVERIYQLHQDGHISQEEYENMIKQSNAILYDMPPHLKKKTDSIPKGMETQPKTIELPSEPLAAAVPKDLSPAIHKQKQEKKPVSTMNIVLIIGVLFIILAGLIFSTTTWQYLPNFIRTVIILSLVFVFFGTSAFAEKKLNLKSTGAAFYTLGSIFLPITVLAIGFFQLFGAWFSLVGEGRYLLGVSAFLLLGIAAGFGAIKYHSPYFRWTMLSCMTLGFMSLARSIFSSADIWVLCFSIYATSIVILGSRFSRTEQNKNRLLAVVLADIKSYSMINTCILSLISIMITGYGVLAGLGVVIFAGTFLSTGFYEGKKAYGIYPFTILLMIGFAKLNIGQGIRETALLVAISGSAILILDLMNLLQEKAKRALGVAGMLAVILGFLFTGAVYVYEGQWSMTMVGAVGVLFLNITWLLCKYKQKGLLYLHPIVFTLFLFGVTALLLPYGWPKGLIVSILSVLGFVGYHRIRVTKDKLSFRTGVSDVLFVMCCLWGGFRDLFVYREEVLGWIVLISFLICCTLIAILSFENKKSISNRVYAWVFPYSLLVILIPIAQIIMDRDFQWTTIQYLIVTYMGVIMLTAILSLILQKRYTRLARYEIPFGSVIVIFGLFVPWISAMVFQTNHYPIYVWFFTFYWAGQWILNIRKSSALGRFMNLGGLFYTGGIGLFLSVFITGSVLFPESRLEYILAIPAGLAVILFGIYLYLYLIKDQEDNLQGNSLFYLSAGALYIMGIVHTGLYLADTHASVISAGVGIVLIGLGFAALCIKRLTVFAGLPLVLIYPLIYTTLGRFHVTDKSIYMAATLIAFVLFTLFSRGLYKEFYSILLWKKRKILQVDWFGFLNVMAPLYLFYEGSRAWQFAGYILLGAYFLSFYKRLRGKQGDRIALTILCFCLAMAYWVQPFIRFSDILRTELNLIPVGGVAIVMQQGIWREYRRETGLFSFVAAIFCYIILAIEGVLYGYTTDALIIGIGAMGMLLLSFYWKKKRWFLLATVVLVLQALYMSKSFWLSLAWWVYLLAAGILLIGIAAVNERYRQKGGSSPNNVKRFMNDWSW